MAKMILQMSLAGVSRGSRAVRVEAARLDGLKLDRRNTYEAVKGMVMDGRENGEGKKECGGRDLKREGREPAFAPLETLQEASLFSLRHERHCG